MLYLYGKGLEKGFWEMYGLRGGLERYFGETWPERSRAVSRLGVR